MAVHLCATSDGGTPRCFAPGGAPDRFAPFKRKAANLLHVLKRSGDPA